MLINSLEYEEEGYKLRALVSLDGEELGMGIEPSPQWRYHPQLPIFFSF